MKANGDCFVVAGSYALNHPEVILVHGIVTGQGALDGVRFPHAWVEIGGKIIDKSNGNDIKINKELYYALGSIDKKYLKKYNHKQLLKYVLDTENWGPWEKPIVNWKIRT